VLRRAGLVGLLVYVTLDLSLPAMPGAFVFEADDSVESVHSARGRVVRGLDAVASEDVGCRSASSLLRIDVAPAARVARPATRQRRSHALPRATLAVTTIVSASPLEDPH
jgi:hypothetical protein